MGELAGYLIAAGLGGAVGATELASRYRDDPGRSLIQPAALMYTVTNAAASAVAVAMIRIFGWTFGQQGAAKDLMQVLLGGLGAIALFRTKLFAASERGSTLNWGPSGLLERILSVSDRQVDRYQAKRRSNVARKVMTKVSFKLACLPLPAFALNLLESSSKEEQDRLRADVASLIQDKLMTEEAKSLLLGVAVMRVTGVHLFTQAVEGLGAIIEVQQRPPALVDETAAVSRVLPAEQAIAGHSANP